MSYGIQKGVSIPTGNRKPYGYYEQMIKAISGLEVDDPCAVKLVFASVRECEQARQIIYGVNVRLPKYRFSVMLRRDETALYVRKISR